jgi:hypothetical protein
LALAQYKLPFNRRFLAFCLMYIKFDLLHVKNKRK